MGGFAIHRVESVVGHDNDVDIGTCVRQQRSKGLIHELVFAGDELPFSGEIAGVQVGECFRFERTPVEMAGDVDAAKAASSHHC